MKIIMKNQILAYFKVRKVVPFIYERVRLYIFRIIVVTGLVNIVSTYR